MKYQRGNIDKNGDFVAGANRAEVPAALAESTFIEGKQINPELVATAGTWIYLDCHCSNDVRANGAHLTHECGACGKKDLRFIHTLENAADMDVGPLEVCIECARVLIGDVSWDIPGEAEEAKRKART
jgi:hypothetical protein